MAIVLQCPSCGVSSPAADSLSGRTVRCKKCATPFVAQPTLDGSRSDTRKSQPADAGDPFPTLPAEFGRYRVVRLLGKGGMGAVYLATDSELGREVALKIPFFDAKESPHRAERFVREARAAAALHHPHVCTVFDAGRIGGTPFLTMAFVAGSPLDRAIDPESPLPQPRAAEIARQVALGLAHAHGKGVVHRDLKPANVMLAEDGEPVVMDFGLAKRGVGADPNEAKLTRDGGVLGTPSYMSPEQVRGDADVGPATDIYSLGVLLFEMLTGHTPYSGGVGAVMGQILAAPVPPLSESRPDADPRLDAICRRAMAKSAADRYPGMAAFAQALGEYLTAAANPTVSVELVEPAAAPAPPVVVPAPVSRPAPAPAAAPFDELTAPLPRRKPPAQAKAAPAARARNARRIGIAAGIALAVLVPLVGLGSYLLRVEAPNGTLIVEVADDEVEAKVKGGKLVLSGPDGKERYTLSAGERNKKLDAGDYTIRVEGADGLTLDTPEFTLKKGEKVTVRVTLEKKKEPKPGPANAPSSDRSAGEYVLSIGGTVNDNRSLKTASDLPNGFRLTKFDLGGTLPNADVLSRFEGCKNVLHLYLVGAGVTDECLGYFKDCKSLNRFELGGTRVTAKGLSHFGDCKDLDFLGLNDSGVNDEGLSQFRNCKKITTLELASQQGTDAGLSSFGDCKGIVSLNLKNSRVTDASVEMFKECKNLHALSLAFTGVSGSCLLHFPNLRTLWLEGSRIGNDGLRHVGQCRKLEYLELEGAPVGDGGLGHLKGLTALRRLRLRGTKVTEQGVRDLADSLPECRIEWDGGVVEATPTGSAGQTVRPAGGFVPLFNGKDLTGWKTHKSQPGDWRVENGVLVGSGPRANGPHSHLYTERGDYADFHLRAEGRINDGGNSGVFGRCSFGPVWPADKPEYVDGYEAEINSTHKYLTKTGSLYAAGDGAVVIAHGPAKFGEWFSLELIARGNRITVKVNGRVTADYIDLKRRSGTGHIALQQHDGGTVAEFRTVEIEELPAEKPAAAADPFREKSVWRSDDGAMVLTVTERTGETFRARWVVGASSVQEVAGTVKDGKVSWLSKDVRNVGGNGGKGDNLGTIFGENGNERIDFEWRVPDRGSSGKYTLRQKPVK